MRAFLWSVRPSCLAACPVVSLSFDNKALYCHGSCLGSSFTASTGDGCGGGILKRQVMHAYRILSNEAYLDTWSLCADTGVCRLNNTILRSLYYPLQLSKACITISLPIPVRTSGTQASLKKMGSTGSTLRRTESL